MNNKSKSSPQVLLPVTLGSGRIPFARGMCAGDWIFASGVMATDFENGLDPEIYHFKRSLTGTPKWYREAVSMFTRAKEVLEAGGTDFSSVVRTDQYYPDWRAVPFFHQARVQFCGNYIAPSTSILESGLLLPDAAMSMELLAVNAHTKKNITPIFPEGLDLPSTSSFVPVVTVGDFVFVAGFLAAWKTGDLGGIAPEAKVPEGHLWKGNRIQLEVDYIIRKKLIPALKSAGSSLANVVKAQVYLSDIKDVSAFNQVWERYFGKNIPATTVVATMNPGFAISDAKCEINLIAIKDEGRLKKRVINADILPVCENHPTAVHAGDLLFFSGMVAADDTGIVHRGRTDQRQPYFGCSVEGQMEYLLDAADKTCKAAGTSLENVVRIQQFHTDLNEFYTSCKAWQKRLPGYPLPISAIQTPQEPVPGCTIQVDLWIYAP